MDQKLKKNVLLRYMKSMRKTPAAVAAPQIPLTQDVTGGKEEKVSESEEDKDKKLTERAIKELNTAAMREAGTLPPTKTTANKRFLENTISHCLSHNKREDKKVEETSKKLKDLSKDGEETQDISSSSSSPDEDRSGRKRRKSSKNKEEKS